MRVTSEIASYTASGDAAMSRAISILAAIVIVKHERCVTTLRDCAKSWPYVEPEAPERLDDSGKGVLLGRGLLEVARSATPATR